MLSRAVPQGSCMREAMAHQGNLPSHKASLCLFSFILNIFQPQKQRISDPAQVFLCFSGLVLWIVESFTSLRVSVLLEWICPLGECVHVFLSPACPSCLLESSFTFPPPPDLASVSPTWRFWGLGIAADHFAVFLINFYSKLFVHTARGLISFHLKASHKSISTLFCSKRFVIKALSSKKQISYRGRHILLFLSLMGQ